YDCVFVTTNPELEGMQGMDIVQILAFFSFIIHSKQYPCAVAHWFVWSEEPDEYTGMWIIFPGFNAGHHPDILIIHVNTIYCTAHLIPVYGTQAIPPEIHTHHSYNFFGAVYVNRFADHHAFEIMP
ncbi:hypothetical protein PAXRUDRAFT_153894, partial [Paxillus rubicundulus Ve08.2h10]